MVKNLPGIQETQVWSLGWEAPLEKRMATDSSILAWTMGLKRIGHGWMTNTHQDFSPVILKLGQPSGTSGGILSLWTTESSPTPTPTVLSQRVGLENFHIQQVFRGWRYANAAASQNTLWEMLLSSHVMELAPLNFILRFKCGAFLISIEISASR